MHEARNSWLVPVPVQLKMAGNSNPDQHKPQGGLRPHPPCPLLLIKGNYTGSQLNTGSQLLHFRWHLRWWRSRLLTWRRLPRRSAHWPRRKWREIQIVIGLCFKGCSKDKIIQRDFFWVFLIFKKKMKIVKRIIIIILFFIQKMNIGKICYLKSVYSFFKKTFLYIILFSPIKN